MEKRRAPKLRFQGFTDDWEQRKLADIADVIDPHPSHRAPAAVESGIPFIGIGDVDEVGNINYSTARIVDEKIYDEHHKRYDLSIPSIGIGRVASLGKVIRLRNDIGKYAVSPTMSIIQFDSSVNGNYMYSYMTSPKFQKQFSAQSNGSTRQSVGIQDLRKLIVEVPVNTNEQEEIGRFFWDVDNTITLHQRKYDMLQKVKKSMLEKMFPKNGSKVPEIRFAGFTDDWEQRKVSELVEKYEDPVETPHNGYTRLGIRSHAKGTFHEYVEPGHELETAQMHRVAANKLIFNITFAWEHAVAITDEDDAGKLVSHRFPQFSLSDSLSPEFLQYVILDEDFHHHLYLASPGGAGRNRVLKIKEALDYPIYYPSVNEQHKIGMYLDMLTYLITLHQRKLEKLKKLKKSMLEEMFV